MPMAVFSVWYTAGMTKPNGKPCRRCGGPRVGVGKSQLCEKCHGTCARCGAPTPLDRKGYHRSHCGPCKKIVEQRETCSKCGAVRTGSHPSYCKACYNAYKKEWEETHPEAPERRTERQWRRNLRRYFNMTPDDWERMFEAQGRGCAICGATEHEGRGKFHVDHCHTTNRARAILCNSCNLGLGMFADDPVRLRAAADYVELHASRHASAPAPDAGT